MRINEDNLESIVAQLKDSFHPFNLKWLRQIHEHYGSVFCLVEVESGLLPTPDDYDGKLYPFHTHHTVGRGIRNWLINYGVNPVGDNGEYLLDEIWAPVTEMAIGVREVNINDLGLE